MRKCATSSWRPALIPSWRDRSFKGLSPGVVRNFNGAGLAAQPGTILEYPGTMPPSGYLDMRRLAGEPDHLRGPLCSDWDVCLGPGQLISTPSRVTAIYIR